MSDEEDDYLSDKFLAATTSSAPRSKTYSQLRKEAHTKAALKNEHNRIKSRRQRELDAREEGLSKSLFEREREDKEAGISTGNKALSMMMKMGFKPGQSLGKIDDAETYATREHKELKTDGDNENLASTSKVASGQIVEPIPVNEWAGKKGIGLGKRARSPTAAERVAKIAKMAEEAEEISHQDFRGRASREYEERRAEGRLGPSQRTCFSLDEKAGKPFHVLWLNPDVMSTFPDGLLEELILQGYIRPTPQQRESESIQDRLRRQMKADALRPLDGDIEAKDSKAALETFPPELVDEALQFLRLPARSRLELVLSYLRDNYAYCFWCGVEYEDHESMEKQCPGPDEELHD